MSRSSSSCDGSGAKNTFVVRARPRMAPNLRRGFAFLTGTSRTTGVRPRAITTSSPAQARYFKPQVKTRVDVTSMMTESDVAIAASFGYCGYFS